MNAGCMTEIGTTHSPVVSILLCTFEREGSGIGRTCSALPFPNDVSILLWSMAYSTIRYQSRQFIRSLSSGQIRVLPSTIYKTDVVASQV